MAAAGQVMPNDWQDAAEDYAMYSFRQLAARWGIVGDNLHDWIWMNMGYVHNMRHAGSDTNAWWTDMIGQPQQFQRAWIWLRDCTPQNSERPYVVDEPGLWWPIVIRRAALRSMYGGWSVMYLCPSLVQSQSRVWRAHTTRCVLARGPNLFDFLGPVPYPIPPVHALPPRKVGTTPPLSLAPP